MASTAEIVKFLQRVPMFQGLNNRQLARLAGRFVERSYAPGAVIVTQGLGGEGFFVVVSGKAEATRERADGGKVVVNTFGPTDFFGELALLDEGPRSATVTATEATTCLVLVRWEFVGILQEDNEMAIVIAQTLARRFRMALDALQ